MTKPTWDRPPEMQIDPSKSYAATMETSKGPITIDLFAAQAPRTVNNFVFLARQGFYDGLIFHRVIPEFVIQGGDPKGTGHGDAGYELADELDNDLTYEEGTLAMANAGPDTNGSQFFIVEGMRGAMLPKKYSIFGKVRDGMDVVHEIAHLPTDGRDRPHEEVTIDRVEVTES